MAMRKETKVLFAGIGGGALAVVGGALILTGVGSGAGAVLLTSGLAAIGGVVGGGMLAGIGVLAAGSATAAAISAALAHKVIKDPELKVLAEKLQRANELYEISKRRTQKDEVEIKELNKRISELLTDKKADRREIEKLKERLIIIITKLDEHE